MKKLITIIIILAAAIYLIPSCDIVEEPYLKPIDTIRGSDTTEPVIKVRKVLLEDFTGQKCPNCPEAAEISHSLIEIYGEQVVVIAIHSGNFSVPDATGDFTADFRTAEGTELDQFFGIYQYGYPMGMINRSKYNNFPVVLKDDWEAAVVIQLEKEVEANIELTNLYDAGTRELECLAESEFLKELDGSYKLCVFIIESGIISPQQTEAGVVANYEHNHMLRGSMNSTWGELVGGIGTGTTGETFTNSYTLTLPDTWTAENCSVVAYIYNIDTQEVLQAEKKAVISR